MPILCRKINIKIENNHLQLSEDDRFAQLLVETPAIAKYEPQLNICITQSDFNFFEQPQSAFECHINQVLRQLTRLSYLTVSHYYRKYTDWNDISPSMQCLLLNLIHLPILSHLNLRWIGNFPISDLITCTNVEHLSIEEPHIDEAAVSLLHSPIHLEALDITMKRGPEMPRLL